MECKCPHCGAEYDVAQTEFGKFVRCQICRNEFVVGQTSTKATNQGPKMAEQKIVQMVTKDVWPGRAIWSGRITRKRFWMISIGLWLIFLLSSWLCSAGWLQLIRCIGYESGAASALESDMGIAEKSISQCGGYGIGIAKMALGGIVTIAIIGCLVPVTVKRMHDLNVDGRMLLAFVALLFLPIVRWFDLAIGFVAVGCLDGTIGPNDFGKDPKERIPEDRLLKLVELKNAGIITEEVFWKRRSALLP